MKTTSGRNSRATHNGNHENGTGDGDRTPERAPGPLVQFAADRAHDAADALYEQAKQGIDRAQRAISTVHVDSAWERVQPALVTVAGFVRHYPLRAAMVVALLASAFWVTRVPDSAS